MMRKAILFLAVLLLAIPAMSQNSTPENVNITVTLETGCSITLSDTVVSGILPVPSDPADVGTFFPMDVPATPILIDILGRLATEGGSHRGSFCITTADFTFEGVPANNRANLLIKFSFVGSSITGEFMAGNIAETVQIWQSSGNPFQETTDMTVMFGNLLTIPGGTYTGNFTFEVIDVII